MKRTLIIAAVLLSTVAFALPASASSIDSYIDGPWLKFMFGANESFATACTNCSTDPGADPANPGNPPWTFSATSATELRITDAFQRGDSFNVFDFGGQTPILTTPSVGTGVSCGDNPELCYGMAGVSYDSLILAAGPHSLTIQMVDSPYGGGAAYFRIDRIVATPEPLSIMLLGLGLLSLGAIRRSRG